MLGEQVFDTFLASPVTWGVLALIALALALSGRLSMAACDYVLALAAALAIFGIYRAPLILQQDVVVRLLLTAFLGSAIGLGAVALSRWLHPEVILTFKDSPLFTPQIKRRIQRDVTRYRDYFIRLSIPVPKELPPIRVQTGPNSGSTGLFTPPTLPEYRWEMVIGEKSINDPMAGTDMYGSFVVGQLLHDPKVLGRLPNNIQTVTQNMMASTALSTYFNSSSWNKKPQFSWPWTMRLWKIRDRVGHEFADKMIAYALMSMVDNPAEEQETKFDLMKNFDVYFFRKLKVGDSVVDNESRRWPEIVGILKADGVPTDE